MVVPSILTRCEISGAVVSGHVLLARGETRVRHFLAGLGVHEFTTANVPPSSVPARAGICFGSRAVRECGSRTGFSAVAAVSCVS
jgi:hypothetical protein